MALVEGMGTWRAWARHAHGGAWHNAERSSFAMLVDAQAAADGLAVEKLNHLCDDDVANAVAGRWWDVVAAAAGRPQDKNRVNLSRVLDGGNHCAVRRAPRLSCSRSPHWRSMPPPMAAT